MCYTSPCLYGRNVTVLLYLREPRPFCPVICGKLIIMQMDASCATLAFTNMWRYIFVGWAAEALARAETQPTGCTLNIPGQTPLPSMTCRPASFHSHPPVRRPKAVYTGLVPNCRDFSVVLHNDFLYIRHQSIPSVFYHLTYQV